MPGYGPCCCILNQSKPVSKTPIFIVKHIKHTTTLFVVAKVTCHKPDMSEDTRLRITTLNADGSNWVTYHDRMLWTIGLRNLSPHLTETTITTEYTDTGNVGIMTPAQCWDLDQRVCEAAHHHFHS